MDVRIPCVNFTLYEYGILYTLEVLMLQFGNADYDNNLQHEWFLLPESDFYYFFTKKIQFFFLCIGTVR